MAHQLRVGIQGGVGSFNEQALRQYLKEQAVPLDEIEIKYLHTVDRVLHALQAGEIERGQFATENSIGGPVEEALRAQAKYSFNQNYEVIDRYCLQIVHCLMIHPAARLGEVDTIVSHPQVFAQCRKTIAQRYARMVLQEGEDDFIDPARVGEAIASGLLSRNVATISNQLIAEAWGLKVVDHNLQDRVDNFTTFVFVKLNH